MKRAYLSLTILVLLVLIPCTAFAASGYVSGTLKFWNKQGNYCPNTRNCTGATYPQSQYDNAQPVKEVQVQVLDNTWAVLGEGTSDTSGNFKIYWYRSTLPPSGMILWKARQKDSRWQIVSASTGGIYVNWTGTFTLINGTTYSNPQNVGTFVWGSSASPNHVANLYDGAWRQWNYALSGSGHLSANMTNVTIRAFDNTTCPSSCSRGWFNDILIDSPQAALTPQGRIMHEMGHFAVYVAKPYNPAMGYDYPNQCRYCGTWGPTTQEWQSAAFEEGIASFFATAAMYSAANPNPTDCLSAGYCELWWNNIETSTGWGSCSAGEDRWPLSHERYLWDVYDSVVDGNYSDTISVPFWYFISSLLNYPTGTNDQQHDEPWNASYSAIDDYDGRSSGDFYYNFYVRFGIDTAYQVVSNCPW